VFQQQRDAIEATNQLLFSLAVGVHTNGYPRVCQTASLLQGSPPGFHFLRPRRRRDSGSWLHSHSSACNGHCIACRKPRYTSPQSIRVVECCHIGLYWNYMPNSAVFDYKWLRRNWRGIGPNRNVVNLIIGSWAVFDHISRMN
jgi:hypothetical protein